MSHKGKAAETEQAIRKLLEPRLQKLGPVSSNDAWVICRSNFGYTRICTVFRKVMQEMEAAQMAENIKHGLWWIRKNKYTE